VVAYVVASAFVVPSAFAALVEYSCIHIHGLGYAHTYPNAVSFPTE
jgi:hypothetical protein